MKKLILEVQNKTEVRKISEFCTIIYISKFLNVVGIEIDDRDIYKLEKDKNILSYRESEDGNFQLAKVV
ncbi:MULTISPECIES: hypothetical protein [Bacillus]|uniref:hypothetical protein n=1 Tax=Bacillus TaxID=1386 RepID=UPI0003719537|nr:MULTISPECIES: hypothetical protein [Bacillus]